VWQRFGKTLATDECVIRFIGCIAELSGVGHEQSAEGLVIFSPVHMVADGVIRTDAAAEITCPAPQPAESGEANPADAPAAGPAPQPSDDVSDTVTQEPRKETAATPMEDGQAAAVAGAGSGDVA
jgi:hypothetical protein